MKEKTKNLILAAVFTGITALCSWLAVPAPIPFTLQTLGVYLCCGILGGKAAVLSTVVYIVLGGLGLPLFSGFQGGVGALFGATGGFILGFLFIPLCVWVAEKTGNKNHPLILGGTLGTILCYAVGILWYSLVYMKGSVGIAAAFVTCVLPFIIPDAIKLWAAHLITNRINKVIKK